MGTRQRGALAGRSARVSNVMSQSLSMNLNRERLQIAHTMLMFQWQDGREVIVSQRP